jgi:hypothetical protein
MEHTMIKIPYTSFTAISAVMQVYWVILLNLLSKKLTLTTKKKLEIQLKLSQK